jgi:tetratricopeptide (TPR) repeat protein
VKYALSNSARRLAFLTVMLSLAATGQGDDLDDPMAPLPLFAPPESIRLAPAPSESSRGGGAVESKEELYERLRQGLLDLELRLQQQSQPTVVPNPPPTEDEGEPEESPPDSEMPLPTPMTDVDTSPSDNSNEDDPTANESDPIGGADTAPTTTPTILSDATISNPNLPALADNLYALGEYDLAYNSYEQLDLQSLSTENQIWVSYQLAGCLRHLGQADAAAQLYRQVLSQHPEHHLAGVSRWWLDAMEENTEQTQAADAFRASLERLKELHDATVTP